MVWETHRKNLEVAGGEAKFRPRNQNPNFIDIEWLQEWFWALILVSKVWLQWGWRPLFIGWRPALILKGLGFLPVRNLIPLLIPSINPWSFLRRINDWEVLDSLEKSVHWLVEKSPRINLWNSEFYSESEFYRPLFFPLFSLVSWTLRVILGSEWRYGFWPQVFFEWAALIRPLFCAISARIRKP